MIELTKEELREIFWVLDGCSIDYTGKKDNVLLNKIKHMIINYCDHEWDSNLWGHCLSNFSCNKCNKKLDDKVNNYQQ